MVTVLVNIRSTHNVGSIFRTADAAGVEKLYLTGITPTPLDRFKEVRPEIAKVALGAEKTVAWEHTRSAVQLIKKLKKEGYKIFAIEQSKKSTPYHKLITNHQSLGKVALVVGNEVRGLPPTILKQCDKILEIPMHGTKESLNVAVAFGIVAFHLKLAS